jgi:hypothetical protein
MVRITKSQAKQKEQAKRFLAPVPDENIFWCHDGKAFKSLQDLANGLEAMSDETFAYHSNEVKKDFSNWVRDIIKDEELASDLASAGSRTEAAVYVSARVTFLSSKLR